jgi:hypothetical protein
LENLYPPFDTAKIRKIASAAANAPCHPRAIFCLSA